ncbi:glycerate kinase [Acholeplasma granularum]|uniref:glycerate kinase family protein n=1 Tax=Acholeplasma granularum TaxID=264635 RepID=UPI00046F1EA0|nr:glycerate kinase [Acholeplasma granularum]
MKIIIAPDSFKSTLSALKVASAIKEGFLEIFNDATYILIPIADGGEGTLNSLMYNQDGKIIEVRVKNALLEDTKAYIGITDEGKTAIVESALACGIEQIPPKNLNPLKASSYGVGQLIKNALQLHVKKIIIGVGSTATNDCGAGMLIALGAKLINKSGQEMNYKNIDLNEIASIDLTHFDKSIYDKEIIVASDVNNPLLGLNGATYTYGPQKGATQDILPILEKGMKNFSTVSNNLMHKSYQNHPGSGSGGGLGFSLLTYFNATIMSGIGLMIQAKNIETLVYDADILITGEGKIDEQTIFGKGPYGLVRHAKLINPKILTIGISGSLGNNLNELYNDGFDAVFNTILTPGKLEEISENTYQNIKIVSSNIARLLKVR